MTKIMLVEDDKSLREIYGVRLLAEGYDIVTAGDGEEALAMAIKERPQLIVTDVMMPKISGFDFLDILRSTTETKAIKVIMMTALSSEEQRERGVTLGADRYLIKSQVGIEDVVRVVREVLNDNAPAATPSATAPRTTAPTTPPVRPSTTPEQSVASGVPTASSAPTTVAPAGTPSVAEALPKPGITPPASQPVNPAPSSSSAPQPAQARARVIEPINDPNVPQVNINDLLDKELAKEAGIDGSMPIAVSSTEQEKTAIEDQISQFEAAPAPPEPTAQSDIPTIAISDSGEVADPQQQPAPVPQQPPITPAAPVPPAPQIKPQPPVTPPPTA